MTFEGRVEVSGGRHLQVRDEGRGEAVLLLHGFTGSAASMAPARSALPLRHRTVSVDLLGHGRSDAPADPSAYQMETCCKDLVAVLDARRIERAHVIGYSLGARIALALAVAAPERVASVVGIGSRAGIAEPGERAARIHDDELLAADIEARGIDWFVDHWMALPIFASQARLGPEALETARKQRQANRVQGLAASLRGIGAGAQPPLLEALRGVLLPVLLVTGSEDERFTAAARDLAERLPNATLETLPQAGHAAHLENPQAFAAALARHFSSRGTEGAVDEPRPGSLRAWLRAARPATLPASAVPVAVGTSVAVAEDGERVFPALTCLAVAVSLQLASNFVNDYADFERGTDDADRLGPPRAAQRGWLTPRQLRVGAAAALGVAALGGLHGLALGGLPIALAGALALVCAWAYTAGPYPLGYHGFGDALVFVFFGIFAVVGTHWVQAVEDIDGRLAELACLESTILADLPIEPRIH